MLSTRHVIRACLGEAYSHGVVMIRVPQEQAAFILDWANLHIRPEMLLPTDNGSGREVDIHITAKYGLTTPGIPPQLYQLAALTEPFPIRLGAVSLFQNEPHDVVKLKVESPGLLKLNRLISQLPNEDRHPHYVPHCTLAYVKPGSADKLVGQDIFAADGAPSPVFTAYGMIYKGATPLDGSDADRPQEEYLFSKTKDAYASAMKAELATMESAGPFDGLPFPTDPKELARFFLDRTESPRKLVL